MTCATPVPATWVRQGLDLRLVAELLGHRTLQMSMRYFHLAKEHLKSAISEAMER